MSLKVTFPAITAHSLGLAASNAFGFETHLHFDGLDDIFRIGDFVERMCVAASYLAGPDVCRGSIREGLEEPLQVTFHYLRPGPELHKIYAANHGPVSRQSYVCCGNDCFWGLLLL